MAANYRFFKIADANAEIDRLTNDNSALKQRAEAAEQNAADVAEQAEKARKETEGSPNIQKLLDDEKAAHTETRKQLEKATADLKAAKDEAAALPEKIKTEGAKEAQKIMASLGQPPIQTRPAENPAATQKTDLSQLTGLEKTKASFIANLKSQKA